jgi:hypothetical protein
MVRHQWQRHPKGFLARSMAITSFLFDHDLSIIPGGWSLYFSAVDGTFLSNLIVYCLTQSSCTEVNDRISRHKFGFFFQAPCQTSCTLAARQHNVWLFVLKDGGRQCHDGRRYVIVESFEILFDCHRLPEDGMSQRHSQLGCLVQFV